MTVAPLRVEPLARQRGLTSLVARWFIEEWPAWYGPGGPGNVAEDLEAFAASEQLLPIGFIVFQGELPVGTGALKATSIPSHTHLSPWVAAGFVLPEHRGKGVGSFMLQELVAKAHQLGYERVYCGTSTSESLLVRAGWSAVAVTQLEGKDLTIFASAA
jgi:GNAT superfamily N-acetyltransferase